MVLGDIANALGHDIETTIQIGKAIDTEQSKVTAILGDKQAAQLTKNFYNALQRGDRIQLDKMERFLPEDLVEARVRGSEGQRVRGSDGEAFRLRKERYGF